ncbi:MAG: ATP-binding cassette domain-containing protein [Pseudomonadota bacterium]
MDQPKTESNAITQFLSVSEWRNSWDAYVQRAQEDVAKQKDAPPTWVRFISGSLGFFSSLLALGIPGIALLIMDRLIPSGTIQPLWSLAALGVGTAISVCLIDLMRMRALQTYFVNARGLVLYQDSCFAVFWAVVLAFLHPVLSLITLVSALTLAVVWWARKPKTLRAAAHRLAYEVDPVIADSAGLGPAYLQQAAEGKIDAKEQPDFQTIGQSTWLNLIQLLAGVATIIVTAWLQIRGSITPGVMLAAIFLNQYIVTIFVRFYQVQALKPPKADLSFLSLLETGEGRKRSAPKPDGEMELLSIVDVEDFGFAPFSADLFQGLCLALIGPSGSGKSELLHAIATGQFYEGKITYRGKNWGRNHGRLDSVSYASIPPVLLKGTVVENVTCFDPKASALPAIELLRKLDPFEDVFRDKDFINDVIDDANIAQAQIVSLARAFWLGSEIIILDQPETYLDKASRSALMSLILKAKTEGKIVILSTDDDYLMSVADELVKLERGEVTDRGPMDEVLKRHHQRWVRVSFKPTKREAFRLSLWLEAQFPLGMEDDLKERVKQTAQDMLFFAPRDQNVGDDEILFDVRMTPRSVNITMHDRGDVVALEELAHDDGKEYQRVIDQSDGFEQTLREGYRQIAVSFTDDLSPAIAEG